MRSAGYFAEGVDFPAKLIHRLHRFLNLPNLWIDIRKGTL